MIELAPAGFAAPGARACSLGFFLKLGAGGMAGFLEYTQYEPANEIEMAVDRALG